VKSEERGKKAFEADITQYAASAPSPSKVLTKPKEDFFSLDFFTLLLIHLILFPHLFYHHFMFFRKMQSSATATSSFIVYIDGGGRT
jgi:hypothetical protein